MTTDATTWAVTVALDDDENAAHNRIGTFRVTAATKADAESAALNRAETEWNPPRRFGVTMGVYTVEAVQA